MRMQFLQLDKKKEIWKQLKRINKIQMILDSKDYLERFKWIKRGTLKLKEKIMQSA